MYYFNHFVLLIIQASLKDTETLFNALEWRLATLRAQQNRAAVLATASATASLDPTSSSTDGITEENESTSGSTSSTAKRTAEGDIGEPDEAKKKRSE